MQKPRLPVLGPFFLAVYPILFLYSVNLSKVELKDVIIALFISVLLTGLLLVIFRRLFKKADQALFVTSLVVFLLFNYGHFYNNLSWLNTDKHFPISVHIILLALWGLLLATGILVARGKTRHLPIINRYIGLTFGLVIAVCLVSIAITTLPSLTPETIPDITIEARAPAVLPDIYYIILDEYTGNSTLRNSLGYDNSDFLASLRAVSILLKKRIPIITKPTCRWHRP